MRLAIILGMCIVLSFSACKSSNPGANKSAIETETADQRNRASVSLLNRIRQLPGVVIRNGVPVFTKLASEINQGGAVEPLYIVDDYIVGNSFRSVNELVQGNDVKKIEALTGPDTSFYGSRGGNGVIVITTYK